MLIHGLTISQFIKATLQARRCLKGRHAWPPAINDGIIKTHKLIADGHCRHCGVSYLYCLKQKEGFIYPKENTYVVGYDSVDHCLMVMRVNKVCLETGTAEISEYTDGQFFTSRPYPLYHLANWQYTDNFSTMRNWELHLVIRKVERGEPL